MGVTNVEVSEVREVVDEGDECGPRERNCQHG